MKTRPCAISAFALLIAACSLIIDETPGEKADVNEVCEVHRDVTWHIAALLRFLAHSILETATMDKKDSVATSPNESSSMANPQPTVSHVWFGWDVLPSEWDILLLSTALKLLLFPA